MELQELLKHADRLVKNAQVHYDCRDYASCFDCLGHLYDYLDDDVGSKARDKDISSESPHPQSSGQLPQKGN